MYLLISILYMQVIINMYMSSALDLKLLMNRIKILFFAAFNSKEEVACSRISMNSIGSRAINMTLEGEVVYLDETLTKASACYVFVLCYL